MKKIDLLKRKQSKNVLLFYIKRKKYVKQVNGEFKKGSRFRLRGWLWILF